MSSYNFDSFSFDALVGEPLDPVLPLTGLDTSIKDLDDLKPVGSESLGAAEFTVLAAAINQVKSELSGLQCREHVDEILGAAFGVSSANAEVADLLTDFAAGNFSDSPQMDILTGGELGAAFGAYAAETDTIYLPIELLRSGDVDLVADVLLEEFGHGLDARWNVVDSPGDEGAIFSVALQPWEAGNKLEKLSYALYEDDLDLITINGVEVLVEQAVVSGEGSISDTGGFEGSTGTIKLPSNGGGTARYDYEFFEIPDQFIIRYEGKNLIDTGFVSGFQASQVQIPEGQSDELQVIVATNDEGTGWEYNVSVDACAATTPFTINLVSGGEFADTDNDKKCEGQGTIHIGREDGISSMLAIDGNVEFDENVLIGEGIVSSLIGTGQTKSAPLFQGKFELDLKTGKTKSLEETAILSNDYKFAGDEIEFSSLTLNQNGIALGAKFGFLEELGLPASALDELFASSSDALLITEDDVDFASSFKFSLPDFKATDFDFLKLIGVKELSGVSMEYEAQEDRVKVQGKLSISPFSRLAKVNPDATLTANFSGPNFVQIQGGKADFVGSLSIEDLLVAPSWSLKDVKLSLDTIKKEVGGDVKIGVPFGRGVSIPPSGGRTDIGFGLGFTLDPLELNRVSGEVDRLNIPIATTGVFLQKVGGQLNNIAPSSTSPIELTASTRLTGGTEFQFFGESVSVWNAELDATFSKEEMKASGKWNVINNKVVDGQNAEATLNWNKGFLEAKGSVEILGGLAKGNAGFKANSNFDIDFNGTGSVGIPKSVPLFGGTQIASGNFLLDYNNNDTLSDDFGAAWGTVEISKLGFEVSFVAGAKVFFDGDIEIIGSKNVPPVGSFLVEPDMEYIIMGADWDVETSDNVPFFVETPDGRIIQEEDFEANQIAVIDEFTTPTSKSVIVFNPTPGIWDAKAVDESSLGSVEYTALRDSEAPTIEVISPSTDTSSQSVDIQYNAFDSDSEAKVQLFYDNDNEGFDGLAIASDLIESDGTGSFTWNTEGIPSGEYHIYAMVMDENNPPAFSYSPGKVLITEEADLSVSKLSSGTSVNVGENITYTIDVTNGSQATAKKVVLTDILPEGLTVTSSSVNAQTEENGELTYSLGDIAAGQTVSVEISAQATLAGTLENIASVESKTYDPDITNNFSSVSTLASEPTSAITDDAVEISVSRTDSDGDVGINENLSYTLTIQNQGVNTATNVRLDEQVLSGAALVDATTSKGNVEFDVNGLSVNIGELQAGEQVSIPVTINSPTAGLVTSTTELTSSEADSLPANNSLISQRRVLPVEPEAADLELTFFASNPTPNAGEVIDLIVAVSNQGPGIASNIQILNSLPLGLKILSASPEQGNYDISTGVWDVGNVRDGLTRNLTVSALVNTGGSLFSTAEITLVAEDDPDSTPGNSAVDEDDYTTLTLNSSGVSIAGLSPEYIDFLRLYGLA